MTITARVKDYWERASCGTDHTDRPKYTLAYFEEIEEFRYRHEPHVHLFAQFTRWHGKKVLEVGVGAGTDFLQFVRAGAKAYGLDLTEEAVKNTKERLNLYGLKAVELRVCNAEKIPYPDNTFDLVYSWGVIHHAEDMEKVFSEIYRVVKIGGTVKIMVYNINSIYTWYTFFRHGLPKFKSRQWVLFHYRESYGTKACTKKQLQALMEYFPHSKLKLKYFDGRIRGGAKFEKLRRLLQACIPRSMYGHICFEFEKALK